MFDTSLLKPGDILLFQAKKGSTVSAWFIAWAQNVIGKNPVRGAKYCHVALVDKDTNYILEARWPKSHRIKADWEKLSHHYDIELWRVKKPVTKKKLQLVFDWAYQNLREWYDLGLFVWGLFDFKSMEVCSTFVAKAWKAGGVEFKPSKVIAGNEHFISPDEIASQKKLIKRIA